MEVIALIQGDEMSNLTPLFLVHAISGLALPFLHLESLSDDDRPVYGITNPIHCPGGHGFKPPSSLKDVAAFYLDGIRGIQPEGPYLLGGWSMGGMIAMFMAQMLEAQGEEVHKVIMIDSVNPEVFPEFESAEEHGEFVKATFERTISAGGLQSDDEGDGDGGGDDDFPVSSAVDDTHDAGDYVATRSRRSSLCNSPSSSGTWSARSSAASIFDANSPFMSPRSPRSPLSDDYLTDDTDCSCDSDCDEPPGMEVFLQNIKTHIHRGLDLVSSVKPGDLFTPGTKSDFDAILVKCTTRPVDVERKYKEHAGAQLIETVMREQNMRWNPLQFRSFQSIPFSGDHDSAFQPQFVGELSAILRECIEDVE
ncbi:beta-ketoacyl synthase [Metarhizium album ARSEF 1941]|uniref:Beta-ketoacyl synthase n=1 Tax=Metarhizium album (strain ARSEF 1941) TaxID=1081103 RepID=A0A0B2WMT5_METAS|nr:beta-ketoacyl synthase [Metarhizium album ARSEF 1941]KHN94315.1 beta-ketoacyl synthase [Metarhizium album ARSEF 1941]